MSLISGLLSRLKKKAGASLVGFSQSGTGAVESTVESQLRKTVWINDYGTLAQAINALGAGGGVVNVPVGRFDAGAWNHDTQYMSTANVTIRGVKMPGLSGNADRLEGGSIIYGRFNAFADNFAVENIGFDLGKYVCDTYFSGYDTHSSNYPRAGGTSTWDSFAFAQPNMASPLAARKNFRAQNVIGLLRDPLSLGHACLMEGFDGGFVDNVIGVYGVHGVVIKGSNVRGGSVAGWMSSTDCVIFKSDSYAVGGDINLASVEARTVAPNCNPWSTPLAAAYGLFINPATASFKGPITVGAYKCFGSVSALWVSGGGTFVANDVQIGEVMADGSTGAMTRVLGLGAGVRAIRWQIGNIIGNNSTVGVEWNITTIGDSLQAQLSIGSCKLTNLTEYGVRAETYGRIRIDSLEIYGAGRAYMIDDNARIMVGKETISAVADKWSEGLGKTGPALGAGWSSMGGGYLPFDVKLEGYGVKIQGTLSNSGAGGIVAINFPAYLRPNGTVLAMAVGVTGNAYTGIPCVIDASGFFGLNAGVSATGAGTRLSVDGMGWQNW